MKRIFVMLTALGLVLGCAFISLDAEEECYLRTEENGLCHELFYLHLLAEKDPRRANAYLGKPISFVAPYNYSESGLYLSNFGYIDRLLHFSLPEGREFLVQDTLEDALPYMPGELLRVSGRISSISSTRIMLLDAMGTPGYPNEIRIEKLKEAS